MLTEILAAVEAKFSGIQISTGNNSVARASQPPRIVWVPVSDTYGPPDGSANVDGRKAIRTRFALVEAHCWGNSLAQAETLLSNVIAALYSQVAGPNLRLGQSKWIETEELHYGMVTVLPFEISIPVYSEMITMPVQPTDTCEPPAAATSVTIVASTPAANEAIAVIASTDIVPP
jgi:hypothetical protein